MTLRAESYTPPLLLDLRLALLHDHADALVLVRLDQGRYDEALLVTMWVHVLDQESVGLQLLLLLSYSD